MLNDHMRDAIARVTASYLASRVQVDNADVGEVTSRVVQGFMSVAAPKPAPVEAMAFIRRPPRHRGPIGPRKPKVEANAFPPELEVIRLPIAQPSEDEKSWVGNSVSAEVITKEGSGAQATPTVPGIVTGWHPIV
jgi:hypothetical protein